MFEKMLCYSYRSKLLDLGFRSRGFPSVGALSTKWAYTRRVAEVGCQPWTGLWIVGFVVWTRAKGGGQWFYDKDKENARSNHDKRVIMHERSQRTRISTSKVRCTACAARVWHSFRRSEYIGCESFRIHHRRQVRHVEGNSSVLI